MLKSCSTCGRIHEYNSVCPKRIEYEKKRREQYDLNKYRSEKNSAADKFRSSKAWQEKRSEIRNRDLNMCRYCFLVDHKITTNELSVHHILPLEKRFDLRLNSGNLITLCRCCHEKAEASLISVQELKRLLKMPLRLTV